ncbi:MAG: hypothetical protein R3F14_43475 [Polyangiaceae bacterium]
MAVVGAVLLGAYLGGYAWARATHRLVHYSGGSVQGPRAHIGFGFTTWEMVFLPALIAEEAFWKVAGP